PGLLAAQTEVVDQVLVAIEILALQVVEEAAALADHLEQAAARVVIFVVGLEVLGEMRDALRQESDLDLGRAGVLVVLPVLRDGLLLANGRNGHGSSLVASARVTGMCAR